MSVEGRTRLDKNMNLYKVMIVVEAVNNGLTSQVVEFPEIAMANDCIQAVNEGDGTGVFGHSARAIPLYTEGVFAARGM